MQPIPLAWYILLYLQGSCQPFIQFGPEESHVRGTVAVETADSQYGSGRFLLSGRVKKHIGSLQQYQLQFSLLLCCCPQQPTGEEYRSRPQGDDTAEAADLLGF